MARPRSFVGFTLVEVLVVITVIGMLVALLMPAIQSAREAARRLQCKNNLKQLALAAITHEEQIGHFPTGGWGNVWAADADRAFGHEQPGGWAFNILPFLEESRLHDQAGDGRRDVVSEEQLEGIEKLLGTVIEMGNCPSRRDSRLYPHWHVQHAPLKNARIPLLVGKLDYAINSGDFEGFGIFGAFAPNSYLPDANYYPCLGRLGDYGLWPNGEPCYDLRRSPLTNAPEINGISFAQSEVGARHVTDGISKTYLIGEKYVDPDAYEIGPDDGFEQRVRDAGDVYAWCVGMSLSSSRLGNIAPIQDTSGLRNDQLQYSFGSAHPSAFHMAFCDGSVRTVNYDIDPRVHHAGANRKDGTVDGAGGFDLLDYHHNRPRR